MEKEVIRYILSPILENEADREECIMEVSLRVWDKIDSFDEEKGSFTAWLTVLARNIALNKRASLKKRSETETSTEEIPVDIPSKEPTPEEQAIQNEQGQAVRNAIEADKMRWVRYVNGLEIYWGGVNFYPRWLLEEI